MEVLILFGCLTVLLALSIPIGISLGLATAITLAATSDIPLIMIAQNAFAALDSFPLLAIPFFMLAGSLMSYGGISRRLVVLAEALVGAIVGGLAMVTVMACMFFAAISGSGPATVSAIGSFMIPAMKEKRYDDAFAAALTATAGSIGIGLLIASGVVAKKKGYPRAETRIRVWPAFRDAFWALLVPVIILGGIYGGIFTPTEAAVVASVYALLIGRFVYRELDFANMYASFRDAALVNGATTFMIGLSMSFAGYLAMEQIPLRIGEWFLSVSNSPAVILLLIDLLLLVIGCFVDNISSMIILTPILLPVVTKLGVDPIHFGLVMTVALATGFVTPPYGANLFVASAVSGVNMVRLSRAVIPFILVMVACLFLFTYVPGTSMALVHALR